MFIFSKLANWASGAVFALQPNICSTGSTSANRNPINQKAFDSFRWELRVVSMRNFLTSLEQVEHRARKFNGKLTISMAR